MTIYDLLEAPQSIVPQDFNLNDPKMNNEQVKELMRDYSKKVLKKLGDDS